MNILIPAQDTTFQHTWGTGTTELYSDELIHRTYQDAIREFGGTPIIVNLQELKEIPANDIHGILLPGGCDVDPQTYECPREVFTKHTDIERDTMEIEFAKEAIRWNIPILGICRGMQILHIASGGKLYQDISTFTHTPQVNHTHQDHTINVIEHDLFRHIVAAPEFIVNSTHHQCIDTPVYPFAIGASAEDGVIEAMYSTSHLFAIGVQFHPERFTSRFDQRIIRAFVRAAEQKQEEMEYEIS